MSKRSLGALIVLNLVLFVGLAVVSLPATPAQAQFGGGNNYVMIAGQTVQRNSQNAVYIAELNTARLIALFVNTSNDSIEVIARHDMAKDHQRSGGSRP